MPSKVRQAEATEARAERVVRVERSCMVGIGWIEVVECTGREFGCLVGKEISRGAIQAMAEAVFGRWFSGKAETRIVRSVNHRLMDGMADSFLRSTER